MQAPNSFHPTVPQGAHISLREESCMTQNGPDSKEGVHRRQKTLGWIVELPAEWAGLGSCEVVTSKRPQEPSFLLNSSLTSYLHPTPSVYAALTKITNQIRIQVSRAKGSYFRSSHLHITLKLTFFTFFTYFEVYSIYHLFSIL